MKKSFIFVINMTFFITLIIPNSIAFAASGACSSHGGVDCSAGADSDGSVICKDGWMNSSVDYSSMVMCSSYQIQQPTPIPLPEPIPVVIPTEGFSDVNSLTPFESSILLLKEKNIISGYPDGSFKPAKTLNRAELLKIVVGAKYPVIEESYNQSCFKDIQKNQWYTKPVCFAKAQGFIEGYADNTFRPTQEVNYVEALKITLESFNLKPSEQTSTWYETYINNAKSLGIDITGSLPTEKLSRAKAAEMIARSLAQ